MPINSSELIDSIIQRKIAERADPVEVAAKQATDSVAKISGRNAQDLALSSVSAIGEGIFGADDRAQQQTEFDRQAAQQSQQQTAQRNTAIDNSIANIVGQQQNRELQQDRFNLDLQRSSREAEALQVQKDTKNFLDDLLAPVIEAQAANAPVFKDLQSRSAIRVNPTGDIELLSDDPADVAAYEKLTSVDANVADLKKQALEFSRGRDGVDTNQLIGSVESAVSNITGVGKIEQERVAGKQAIIKQDYATQKTELAQRLGASPQAMRIVQILDEFGGDPQNVKGNPVINAIKSHPSYDPDDPNDLTTGTKAGFSEVNKTIKEMGRDPQYRDLVKKYKGTPWFNTMVADAVSNTGGGAFDVGLFNNDALKSNIYDRLLNLGSAEVYVQELNALNQQEQAALNKEQIIGFGQVGNVKKK